MITLTDKVKDVNGKRKNKEKREIDEDVREKNEKRKSEKITENEREKRGINVS